MSGRVGPTRQDQNSASSFLPSHAGGFLDSVLSICGFGRFFMTGYGLGVISCCVEGGDRRHCQSRGEREGQKEIFGGKINNDRPLGTIHPINDNYHRQPIRLRPLAANYLLFSLFFFCLFSFLCSRYPLPSRTPLCGVCPGICNFLLLACRWQRQVYMARCVLAGWLGLLPCFLVFHSSVGEHGTWKKIVL